MHGSSFAHPSTLLYSSFLDTLACLILSKNGAFHKRNWVWRWNLQVDLLLLEWPEENKTHWNQKAKNKEIHPNAKTARLRAATKLLAAARPHSIFLTNNHQNLKEPVWQRRKCGRCKSLAVSKVWCHFASRSRFPAAPVSERHQVTRRAAPGYARSGTRLRTALDSASRFRFRAELVLVQVWCHSRTGASADFSGRHISQLWDVPAQMCRQAPSRGRCRAVTGFGVPRIRSLDKSGTSPGFDLRFRV